MNMPFEVEFDKKNLGIIFALNVDFKFNEVIGLRHQTPHEC